MDNKLRMSDALKQSFTGGHKNAVYHKDNLIRIEHVIFGMLNSDNIISGIIKDELEDYNLLIEELNDINSLISENDETIESNATINLDPILNSLIKKCNNKKNKELLDVDLFFIESIKDESSLKKLFNGYGITLRFINNKLKKLNPVSSHNEENYSNKKEPMSNKNNSKTPMLDNYGNDLTQMAIDDHLDPVIGRNNEVQRVAQILTRRKKNNPILIGEPGVGKTAIVENLAIKIAKGDCPRPLIGKKVITLDLTSMVAGTKYRGEFEGRIKSLIDEIKDNSDIILFIDEIHTIVGAGNASGSLDAANIFKPALARGEIQCIGATTLDEYRENIESDGALDRRFQKINVSPPSVNDTIQILNNIRVRYEDYHNVKYDDTAINEIVRLADRYITNREFPDKAIDIMDEAGSRAQMSIVPPDKLKKLETELNRLKVEKNNVVKTQNFEEAAKLRAKEKEVLYELEVETNKWRKSLEEERVVVNEEMIAEVVAMMTDIPVNKVSQNETKKLLEIDKTLADSVIGQQEAIEKVVAAIKRNRTGVKNKNKPIGSFLFVGKTGVGKCHGKGTKIMLHDGRIKNVENIKVGDQLMGDDSKPRNVLSLARGKEQMYKIIPNRGGDSFTCNESHILSLKNSVTKEIVNISIKDYLNKSKTFKHLHKLYRVGVEYDKKELQIDPYFLGLWLGDGISKRVGITTADNKIVDYLNEFKNSLNKLDKNLENQYKISIHEHKNNKSNTYYITNGVKGVKDCFIMNGFNHYSLLNNKHIPYDYLTSDKEDRKFLLAGLIDSDGYMFHKTYEISQKNKYLAEDIVRLSRSLGYCAYIKEKFVNEEIYYNIRISGDLSDLPIKLDRKKTTTRKQIKNVLVSGFKIEKLSIDEYYGFTLDGNHLYLLGDFTVTHNTHLCKVLAKEVFGSIDSMIKVDMSEYAEKFNVSRLIGSPPGYVGYEEGGQLTEKVKNKPYCLVLLDEIEKAHPDIFNILLQVLDEGHLTDGIGRKINFKNTIIIMTSNIGAKEADSFGGGIGFSSNDDESKNFHHIIEKELKKKFRPEFINRLDEIVYFNTLENNEDIIKIVDLQLIELVDRLKENNYNMIYDEGTKKYIAEIGYDKTFGARELERAIQKHIENPISDLILKSGFPPEAEIKVSYNNNKLDISLL